MCESHSVTDCLLAVASVAEHQGLECLNQAVLTPAMAQNLHTHVFGELQFEAADSSQTFVLCKY